jgi:[ribosomal protein S5]-alanine N-acetyltransferase
LDISKITMECILQASDPITPGITQSLNTATYPHFDAFGLKLRPFREGDGLLWLHYLCLPEVTKMTAWDTVSIAELQDLMEAVPGLRAKRFCLARQEDDCLIGTIGFFDMDGETAEIAYDLHPDLWGKGIASAACELMCDWGFSELQLRSIKACARTGNRASVRVLEKCEFTLETTTREIRYAGGKPTDFWVYRRFATQGQAEGLTISSVKPVGATQQPG